MFWILDVRAALKIRVNLYTRNVRTALAAGIDD
jgi:hypothetical protein